MDDQTYFKSMNNGCVVMRFTPLIPLLPVNFIYDHEILNMCARCIYGNVGNFY